jgi:hypothetical protein
MCRTTAIPSPFYRNKLSASSVTPWAEMPRWSYKLKWVFRYETQAKRKRFRHIFQVLKVPNKNNYSYNINFRYTRSLLGKENMTTTSCAHWKETGLIFPYKIPYTPCTPDRSLKFQVLLFLLPNTNFKAWSWTFFRDTKKEGVISGTIYGICCDLSGVSW